MWTPSNRYRFAELVDLRREYSDELLLQASTSIEMTPLEADDSGNIKVCVSCSISYSSCSCPLLLLLLLFELAECVILYVELASRAKKN